MFQQNQSATAPAFQFDNILEEAQVQFPKKSPDSEDEWLLAQWLQYHRFNFKLHPFFEGKTWDFWVPGLQSLVEVKPFAFWHEIDPVRKAVFEQIQRGRRTRALFVEMGRKQPFFHELITPQASKMIDQIALERENGRLNFV